MEAVPRVEKRRALRLKSRLPVRYDSIEYGRHGNGLTDDISEAGVKVTLEEFIPRFSKVAMRIALKPDKPIQLNANVKWAQRLAYSPRYQIGLAFEDVSLDARRNIAEYVSSSKQGVSAQ